MSVFSLDPDLTTIPDFIIYAGAVSGAAIAIVGAVRRWVMEPAARKFSESVKEQILPLEEKIDIIRHEVEVNSGKSLKDAVVKGFADNDKRMSTLEGEMTVVRDILRSNND